METKSRRNEGVNVSLKGVHKNKSQKKIYLKRKFDF